MPMYAGNLLCCCCCCHATVKLQSQRISQKAEKGRGGGEENVYFKGFFPPPSPFLPLPSKWRHHQLDLFAWPPSRWPRWPLLASRVKLRGERERERGQPWLGGSHGTGQCRGWVQVGSSPPPSSQTTTTTTTTTTSKACRYSPTQFGLVWETVVCLGEWSHLPA